MFDVGTSIIKGARTHQDDSYYITDPYATDTAFTKLNSLLVCLADGVGGEAGGDIASRIACSTAIEHIQQAVKGQLSIENIPELLHKVLRPINKHFRKTILENKHYEGMATTMLLCFVECSHLYWLSIGDTRLIRVRGDELSALNEDHSYGSFLDEMAARGDISEARASNSKQRHFLTSYIDGGRIRSIDIPQEPTVLKMNDVLLLATDGINSLKDDEIRDILNAPAEAQTLADELTHRITAKDLRFQDNTTVIVVKIVS